jgi:DNA mismatch endonuclease (patch repair protein)
MSRIKAAATKPEMLVRRECHRQGLRYRLHRNDLPGKPDLVFPKYKTVIFVHGCYWHSHDCRYGSVVPKTNAEFWRAKRAGTIDRDERNKRDLEYLGWRVLTYWECEIKDAKALRNRIRKDFQSNHRSS